MDNHPAAVRLTRRALFQAAALPAAVAQAATPQTNPASPWFFIQLSDPQLGHHDPNDGFEMETATFEFAVASTIRLKREFVVITGDLTNVAGHAKQIAEYKRIIRKFAPSIPVYHLAGNHDMEDPADVPSLQRYRDTFGRDYFSFRTRNVLGLVLNSVLMRTDPATLPDVERQFDWTRRELEAASTVPHKIVFQHHPFFINDPNELLDGSNVPIEPRRRYLELFAKHKVRAVFAGHIHGNGAFEHGGIDLVISGTVGGRPFYGSHFGIRPVIVYEDHLLHRFLPLGRIPLKRKGREGAALRETRTRKPCAPKRVRLARVLEKIRYEAGREFEPYAPFYW